MTKKQLLPAFILVFTAIFIFTTSGQTGSFVQNGKNVDINGIYCRSSASATLSYNMSQDIKSGNDWSSIGPYGGDVFDIAVYSENTDVIIAAAGIPFISYDGGESWEVLESLSSAAQGKDINAVECLDDGTLLAGGPTISGKYYKSTDGGETWQYSYYSSAGGIYDIDVSQSNPDIIYLAVSGSASSSVNRIVLKSVDGGESWSYFNMIGFLPVGASAVSIAIDPDDPETVFFAAKSGISEGYVMATFDGGENWEDKSSNLPASKPYNTVAIAGQKVYLGGGQLFGGNVMGLYESDNYGTSWQSISASFPNKVVNDILIDPDDNDKMYVATEGDGIYFTTNGGASWTYNTSGAGDNGSIRSLIFMPGNTNTLYAGFLSLGVCKSTDAGNSWTYANTGIAALLINDIEVNPDNKDIILASFEAENSGGCYLSNNGGETWELVESLSPTRYSKVEIDSEGTLYAWSNGPTTVAAEGLYKSTDNGQTWENLGPDLGTYFETQIFTIAVSKTDPNLIFIGGNNFGVAGWESVIYKTTDGGTNWDKVEQGAEYDSFRYLFIDPASSDQTVYAAYGSTNQNKGGFKKSTDSGENWYEISNGIPDATKWAGVIVCDPLDTDILYGGIGGFGSVNGSVYKSLDGGDNWESAGLSFSMWSKITDIYVSENDQNVVYAATTDHGIYFTKTAGDEWFEANNGMPSDYVTAFSRSFTENDTLKLLASTYTNSAFKSTVYIPGTTSVSTFIINSFKVLVNPNPANGNCNIRLDILTPGKVKITVYNSNGETVKNLENGYFTEGNYDYFFSDKPGIYLVKIEVNDKVQIDKIILF